MMVKLLAIETSLGPFSVALFDDEVLLEECYHDVPHCQAEQLMTYIADLLKRNDCGYNDLDYIAVAIGPGSFTGIRIGMSAAQGIAIVTNSKLIGVGTLEASAYGKGTFKVALSAGRNQYYCQSFDDKFGEINEHSAPHLISVDELEHLGEGSIIINNTHNAYPTLSAAKIGAKALYKLKHNKLEEFAPVYVRDAGITSKSTKP